MVYGTQKPLNSPFCRLETNQIGLTAEPWMNGEHANAAIETLQKMSVGYRLGYLKPRVISGIYQNILDTRV